MKIETEKYNEALEKYLSDGINWDACNNEERNKQIGENQSKEEANTVGD